MISYGICLTLSDLKVKLLSRVQLFATPWTVAYQAPPSVGFSRQEYWSGVPLPSPHITLSDIYFAETQCFHLEFGMTTLFISENLSKE